MEPGQHGSKAEVPWKLPAPLLRKPLLLRSTGRVCLGGERQRQEGWRGEEGNEKESIGVRDTGRGGMERVEPDYDVMVLLSDFDLI